MATDLIDDLIAEWRIERPDLNAEPMAVIGRILRLARILENDAIDAVKPFHLQYSELDVLATLRRKGAPFQLNPKQLIDSVLITSGAMTACLDRLEKRRLVKRMLDPNDRRGKIIALTRNGKKLVDKAIEARFQQAQDSLQQLNSKEQIELSKLLAKLSKTIATKS